MKFKGKQDLWLTMLLWGSVLFGLVLTIMSVVHEGPSLILNVVLGSMVFLTLFIAWIYLENYVLLEARYLYVRFGPFRVKIYYEDLTKVEETGLILSSLALSLDRLALYKNGHFSTLISVKDKERFLKCLEAKSKQTEIIRK